MMEGTLRPLLKDKRWKTEEAMSWFDWLLIGGLAVLFVLALRHIIRQAKKGRCCGCSGCEGCPSRSGCEEGLGRLEHEEDADSGRSAGQSAAGCRSGGAAEQKHPEKKGGERDSECSGNGPLSHWSKGTGCSNGFPKSGGRKPEASGRETASGGSCKKKR